MKSTLKLVALLALAGCAQSPCSQPDVLAFVDQARRSHDLYAVGLAPDPVRETPILWPVPASQSGRLSFNHHAAVCSVWMKSRNPAFQPGNGQAEYVWEPQNFKVMKLDSGYEVSLYRP